MKRILSLTVAILITVMSIGILSASADTTADTAATLHVEGNQLVDELGHGVRLIGMNVPYMSWDANSEAAVMNAVDIALDDWNSNAIRLAVTPKMWFAAGNESYRDLADRVIEKVAAQGKYVIFDNHSFYLPDDDDIAFWKDAAERYKDHPYVIFELFNEPAMCTWLQYYQGGLLTYKGLNDWGQEDNITINSCGIPKLLETVRSTGAKNVCILPGINWSFDLSYCTEEDFRQLAKSIAEEQQPGNVDAFVEDYVAKYFMKETTGNGIMYSTHPYPSKPSDWDTYLKDTALEYPVLVGECGPTEKDDGFVRALSDNDKSYLDELVKYVDKYELNITPWAWGAWPYLNQEPSDKLSAYGTYMKKYFEKSNQTKAVTLYNEVDYKGESITLEAGKYTATQLRDLGFDLSKIASTSAKDDAYQYTITLYANEDYSGKSYVYVPKSANNSATVSGFEPKSIEIKRSVPENILKGHATVIATGSVDNQPAENIIDGKMSTFWKNKDENPNEIIICLDDVYALNGLTIAHASEASMKSFFNASDYTVSVSTDGKTFERIIDVTDNSLGRCDYDFEQVKASYIKIKITKGSMTDSTNYILTEVMAYGTKYTGSTDGMKIAVGSNALKTAGSVNVERIVQFVLIGVFAVVLIVSIVLIVVFSRKRKAVL